MSEPSAVLSTTRTGVSLWRTVTAFVITAVVTMPILIVLFVSVLTLAYPADAERFGLRFVAYVVLDSLVYGWMFALPPVGLHAVAVALLARRRRDSVGISITVGVGISLLAATGFAVLMLAQGGLRLWKTDPAFPWVLASLPLIFGLSGALVASLHWRIAIHPRRKLRLASCDADAIRAIE
jgi:hypothetical protein